MSVTRETVLARRALPQTIADAFLPLEQSADLTATQALRCMAVLLDARRSAALGVTDGEDILALINEGCNLAFQAQTVIRRAHARMIPLAEQLDIVAVVPECPGIVAADRPPLRSVA